MSVAIKGHTLPSVYTCTEEEGTVGGNTDPTAPSEVDSC